MHNKFVISKYTTSGIKYIHIGSDFVTSGVSGHFMT